MMEDWQQHNLEEKGDLKQFLLTSSDSYTNEGLNEYSEEIKKEQQSQDNNDITNNSAQTDIKTEKVELNDEESNAKFLEYSTNGNEEICQICGLEFGNKTVLKIHNSFVHPEGNKDDQNKDCGRKDESGHENKKTFKCTICEYKAGMKLDIKRHIESVHKRIKAFKCSICDYKTARNYNLKKHIENVHEGIKKFKCNICDVKFTEKGTLTKHIKTVHEGIKPFKCIICDYKTAHKPNLKTHIESVHEKTFKCNICNHDCANEYHLKKHITNCHKESSLLQILS